MPPRSPKMKRRIFGFQRRVWWPKWTPASSSSLMPTSGHGAAPLCDWWCSPRRGIARTRRSDAPGRAASPGLGRGSSDGGSATESSASQVSRSAPRRSAPARSAGQRRADVDRLAGDRMRERQARGVQELALEAEQPGVPYSGSPATGWPIACRCARIWCVRPVSRRTRSSVVLGQRPLDLEVRDAPRAARRCRSTSACARGGRGRAARRSCRCAPAGGPRRARGTRA